MSDWLKKITRKTDKRPDVIVVHGVEGVGKSAFAAQFKEAVFMMSENETGIVKLRENGLVPEIGWFPQFTSWESLREATKEVKYTADRPRTLVVDTVNGIESLLHAHICQTKYAGDWGKKGFANYDEGPRASVPVWREWLADLDAVRSAGTTIVLLSHTKAVKFRNPEGADFDRYVAEMHAETWSATRKFADMILFLNFHVEVLDAKDNRGKGVGGTSRVYHTQRGAAWDAKNRHNLPAKFLGKGSAAEDFKEFVRLVKAGTAQT